ncbi:hypothetical protein BpHYR1_025428 [Brachionus plicatilis]|uniref:Uncharacterized protein n=1 Tax=Brachionus plicatilis TaxID=10195 RepID=A0A3M7RBJ5_BRAPC|nr:hypothetical protein BpHYR1_025428 [Brachionus plicatilis]
MPSYTENHFFYQRLLQVDETFSNVKLSHDFICYILTQSKYSIASSRWPAGLGLPIIKIK